MLTLRWQICCVKSHKPVILAVNKVDNLAKFGNDVYEFYNLGIRDPILYQVLHV